MSLTDWTHWDSELFDGLFDKPVFNLPRSLQLKAIPLTKNYQTVGTAFDYALRLIVAKLNAHFVKSFKMVADAGASSREQILFVGDFDSKRHKFMKGKLAINSLLSDCLVLAKIESQYRSGQELSDEEIFTVDESDIADLVELVGLIDIDVFKADNQCLLNPTFGESSKDIGGADADLIIDDLLIDVKTTKILKFERRMWRQLIGYWLLNIREGEMYGDITQLGVYFSRFGLLYKFPTPEEFHYVNINGKRVGMYDAVEHSILEYQSDILESSRGEGLRGDQVSSPVLSYS